MTPDGQVRLANEQARYQIAFRDDLADLAEQFVGPAEAAACSSPTGVRHLGAGLATTGRNDSRPQIAA